MVIEKIDIKSFGFITDMTLEFSDSVNVIEGQNEAGKSTIAAFIKYMLFGFGSDDGSGVSERAKRINWTTGIAEGSMIARVKDKRYLISRSTVLVKDENGRDSYKEDSSIMDMATGITEFGKQAFGDVIFGVKKDLFENTAFIGQLGDASFSEGSVKQSIENIIFSGSERINIQRATNRISDKMNTLFSANEQSGVIVDLAQKRDALCDQMDRFNADNKEILAKSTELHAIRKKKAEANANLAKLHEMDSSYNDVMRIQTFERLSVLEQESEEKTAEFNKYIEDNKFHGFTPTQEYLDSIKQARANVNETYENLQDTEEAYSKEKNSIGITREIEGAIEESDSLGGEEKVLSDAKTLRIRFARNLTLSILSLLLAITACVCEFVGKDGLASLPSRVIIGILGIVAFAGLIYFFAESVRDRKKFVNLANRFSVEGFKNLKGKIGVIASARAKRDALINSTESARLAFESAKANYDKAKKDLTGIILKWSEEPPVTELNGFLDELETRVLNYLEKLKILRENKTVAEFTVSEVRKSLSGVNEMDVRSRVTPLRRKSLVNINHDNIITGIAKLKSDISDLNKVEFEIESDLIQLNGRVGDPADPFVKMTDLENKIEELEFKHKAYFLAQKAIESASDSLRKGISPRLGEYATDLMSIMTNKKYTSFSVDDGLTLSYLTENGEEKSCDFMSGGTRDLAYVAVRMALIDMLYPEKPPVILDETFAHQDNARAKSMMTALSHLYEKEKQQSFVFTCRDREGILAEESNINAVVFKLSLKEKN